MFFRYLASLLLAVSFVAGAANISQAASPTATATPEAASGATLFVPVQARRNCGNVRAFCHGRHGRGGRLYRNCVLSRGCRLERRLPYCQRAYGRCARNFVPGRPPFRRCMRDLGC